MRESYFHQQISQAFERRKQRNPGYSLRAFSRALKMDPAALSRILAGKQIPSVRLAQKVFAVLEFSPTEQQAFLNSVAQAYAERGYERIHPELKNRSRTRDTEVAELSIDSFRVMSEWYHAAILELTFTHQFKSSAAWIAKELRLSVGEVTAAIDRLERLGLLDRAGKRWVKGKGRTTTADKHLTTPAHRKLQRQLLERAIHSLENDPIEERSMSAMAMAIDPARIPEAKALIESCTHQLCDLLERGTQSRVYNFSMALFPLQEKSPAKTRDLL